MEITDVSATPVVLPTEGSVEASSYSKAGRGTTMVTLETDGDVTGVAEPALADAAVDDVVQFERVGFARIDALDDEAVAYFAHE